MRPLHLFVLALLLTPVRSFYIPGLAPVAYDAFKTVVVHVNGLHSVRAVVPFDFYAAPYCPLVEHPAALRLKFGELVMGDTMRASNYVVQMQANEACAAMPCASEAHRTLVEDAGRRFERLIEEGYRAHLYIDNLPAFSNHSRIFQGRCRDANLEKKMFFDFQRGFPLGVPKGCTTDGRTLINNHLVFKVQYNRVDPKDGYYMLSDSESGSVQPGEKRKRMPPVKKQPSELDDDRYLVVGFTVDAYSIKWNVDEQGAIRGPHLCDDKFDPATTSLPPLATSDIGTRIAWTFSVTWEEADVRWASRWDSYLHTSFADSNDSVHWFSIVNTLLMVVCLASSIAVVLLRALRKDLHRYNLKVDALAMGGEESKEVARDESGWKVVHGDVFRTPRHADTLILLASSGLQLYMASVLVLITACLGFQSPSRRGSLVTTTVFLGASMSVLAGYSAARMRTALLGEHNWQSTFAVGSALPLVALGTFIAANIVLRVVKSSGAIPTFSLLMMVGMWMTVTLPLTVVGASIGRRVPPPPHPTRVNAIPRPIKPPTSILAHPMAIVAMSGVIPLTTMLLELRFIFQSLWQGMVYYVFGFLGVVFALWSLTSALTAVVVVYYRLSAEDYRWWWIAFVAPTSGGLHWATFVVYYYITTLNFASPAAVAIYFIYMSFATLLYVLMGGFVGMFAAWAFVNKIYGTLKLE